MRKCVVVLSANPNIYRLKTVRNDVENIYPIISVSPKIPEWFADLPGIKFLTDEHFLNRNIIQNLNIPRKKWYYQQFLKYEIVLQLKEYSQIHVVDGDSILRSDLYFNHSARYTPININPAYNCLLKKIGVNPRETNFITNEMSFKRVELIEMLTELEFSCENYIHQLAQKIRNDCWFSEYQTYALYKVDRKQVETTKIKVFRRYDLLPNWIIMRLERSYSLVAYESYHSQNWIRKIRAILFYVFNKNLG